MRSRVRLSFALLIALAVAAQAGSAAYARLVSNTHSSGGKKPAPVASVKKKSGVAPKPQEMKTSKHSHRQPNVPNDKAKPKYAYPLDFFMMHAPEFDRTPYDDETSKKLQNAFNCGIAHDITPAQMVRAGVFKHYPLVGGIFKRREPVKYIVLHSTETGPPVPAKNVINAWNSGGRRHPGAQYVVERDGTIYQALDPELAAVHVNIFKTLPGINNDNTIGIEMNRTGKQDYPPEQRSAVIRLISYLQDRFSVSSDNIITHKYAQQGDHTDPVNMDVEAFLAAKESFRQKALAARKVASPVIADEQTEIDGPVASVYVQIHGPIKLEDKETAVQRKASPLSSATGTTPGSTVEASTPHATASPRPPGAASNKSAVDARVQSSFSLPESGIAAPLPGADTPGSAEPTAKGTVAVDTNNQTAPVQQEHRTTGAPPPGPIP